VDVKRAYKHHAVEVEKQKSIKEARYIYIEGSDLELPLTGGKDEPQDKRIYTYYVWAYHPVLSRQKPLADILTNELQVDVLGAKAAIRPAQYSGPEQPAGFSNLTSRTVIEVNINSEDIHQAFEILAWFPKESAEFQATTYSELEAFNERLDCLRAQGKTVDTNELKAVIERAETVMKTENPWQAKKQVRVYNGDMRSKIYMESQDTVSHVFGPQFSKYFFVGRIYMRNKRSDKQLVVYTTSLRAHTLFYRPPDDDLKASKAISKASLAERRDMVQSRIGMQLASENLQHQGEAVAPTNMALTLEEATQVAQMASTNAVNSNPKGLLEVTTNDSPISAGAKLKEAQDIVNRVNSFRQQRFAEMTNEVPKYVMNWSSLDPNQKEQKQSEVTKALESRILKGEQEPSTKETAEQIAVPLSEFQDEMDSELNKIRRQYSGFGSVMDFNVPISVMIDRQPTAFSADARQQAVEHLGGQRVAAFLAVDRQRQHAVGDDRADDGVHFFARIRSMTVVS